MRFEDKKLKAARRKGSWMVGLICGPAFAILFCLIFFIPRLLIEGLFYSIWMVLLMIVGSVAAVAPLADKFGKKYKVTAEQFAGPVAFCSVASGVLLALACSVLIASSQS